jgi:Protein of unknown function (DUF4197)
MKKILIPVITAISIFSAHADLFSSLGLTKSASTVPAAVAALSDSQVANGLKDALGQGLQNAVANLGHSDGFLTNLNVKIPLPEKLQSVEKVLRAAKQDKLADEFVATMNRAAEQAVPLAASVFGDAVKTMSIDDAKGILTGPQDSATQFFRRTTSTNLYAKFYPVVQKATASAGVTSSYKKMLAQVTAASTNSSGLFGSFGSKFGGAADKYLGADALDVDAYVTNKALDGLFKMVDDEEKSIRQNPVARTTDLMKTIFGAVGK